jgi:hypothetical protein
LTDSVKWSISDFRVRVFAVTNNNGNHNLDFLRVIDVLTDLTECHNTGMFVAPIRCLKIDCVDNQLTNEWKHDWFTNWWHKSVYTSFTKSNVIFFLVTILLETFFRFKPFLFDVFLDINHKFKDLLEHVLKQCDILLCKTWLTFNKSYNEFKWLLSDRWISEVFVINNWFDCWVNVNKVRFKKCGFNFS